MVSSVRAFVARMRGWIELRILKVNRQEMEQRGDLSLAKYWALFDLCAPHLRVLRFPVLEEYNVKQWAMMRNFRHLRFDGRVSSGMLSAAVDNLTHLRSIHFSEIDWRCVPKLHNLLSSDNESLQALRLPMCNSLGKSLRLPALPSFLRMMHILGHNVLHDDQQRRDHVDELLELAATYCPQLAILMLPADLAPNRLSLAKLARFEMLFYLRLSFKLIHAVLFGNLLEKIGAKLQVLLLEKANSMVFRLIAKHCPLLEHCSFEIICHYRAIEELSTALQSLFQLDHLRSMSIRYKHYRFGDYNELLSKHVLAALDGSKVKRNLEYLHLGPGLPVPINFVINLINENQMCKLTCKLLPYYSRAQIDELKTLLQNLDTPLELEFFNHFPFGLKMEENRRVRVRRDYLLEDISRSMLQQFWARAMDSFVFFDS